MRVGHYPVNLACQSLLAFRCQSAHAEALGSGRPNPAKAGAIRVSADFERDGRDRVIAPVPARALPSIRLAAPAVAGEPSCVDTEHTQPWRAG